MLDLEEIEQTIAELESGKTTMGVCAKLAVLYAVQERALGRRGKKVTAPYSQEADSIPIPHVIGSYGDSDFLMAVAGKDQSSAWSIMDEHMNAVRILNPMAYEEVIMKLRKL